MRITEANAKKAEPGSKLWDSDVVGFSLWVSPKDRRTFYVQKSVRNQTRREKIGIWPDMSVQDARRQAREIIAGWEREPGESKTGRFADVTTEELALELLRRVQAQS